MTGIKYKKGISKFIQLSLFRNLKYVYWYRRYQKTHGIIARMIIWKLSRKFGLEISTKAQIGKGFYLGHPYNITVGDDVVLGENVNLHKGCTIGRTNRGNAGSPRVGNNVFIGINATVVGKISIGNDVLIASNSYVNVDVPSHSVVIMEIQYYTFKGKCYIWLCKLYGGMKKDTICQF